ncbi:MAG: DUF4168 domain-containing protein [Pseudomonadota bacterium]
MLQGPLPKIAGALVVVFMVIALWNAHGAATVDPMDHKIEAFVEAASAVDQVKAVWQPKIASADADKAAGLRQEANKEIRRSIDAVDGISFADYQSIRQRLASDPELLARVTDIMRDQR